LDAFIAPPFISSEELGINPNDNIHAMTRILLIATPFPMVYPKTPAFRIKLPKQARSPANRLPHNSLFTRMKNRSVLFLGCAEKECYEFF
jgi:hypothetical protein